MEELKSIREILEEVASCDPQLSARFKQLCERVAGEKGGSAKKPPQTELAQETNESSKTG
jgi:hypothetical protein